MDTLLINYRLVGHGVFHIIIGDDIIGNITYGKEGNMKQEAWIARPYGLLNRYGYFCTGKSKYHAVKDLLNMIFGATSVQYKRGVNL